MNCSHCRSCGYTFPVDEMIEGECYHCAPPDVRPEPVVINAPEESKPDDLGPLFG